MKTKIFAHRGASAYAPENTLTAFSLAVTQGADGLELDVHLTRDEELVVLHDSALTRTTGQSGRVEELTLAELRTISFGYPAKFEDKFAGTPIPTLAQVYELIRPTTLSINVELKEVTRDRAHVYIRKLCELAKAYQMEDRVFYSSFDHLALRDLLAFNPDAKVAPLYSETMLDAWDYAARLHADGIHPSYKQLFVFSDYLQRCHDLGISVRVWTVDDPDAIRALLAMGVDAIITNTPDVALAIRDQTPTI